jgi:uncharacterized protein (DUF305 family)
MEKNSIIIGGLMLILGLGVGYVVGGREPSFGNHMMPSGSMMDDRSMMSANIDQHFITQMIPHHEGAIEMAKVALKRSKRPEVIALANGIIEAQQKEITDMRAWYKSWFSADVPHVTNMGHMEGMSGNTSELASVTEAEFDREFLEQMIPHHEMAIMMAQMLKSSTERSEMKQLADNIITSQSNEITTMRSWLGSWYGVK